MRQNRGDYTPLTNSNSCLSSYLLNSKNYTKTASLKTYGIRADFLESKDLCGFRKGRGTRDQIANIRWIMEKAREFQETSISALLTMPKPLTVWITRNCGKF